MPPPPPIASALAESLKAFLHRWESDCDEFELSLADPCVTHKNEAQSEQFWPLDWWVERAQRVRYPQFNKLALNLLSVPVSSAEIEYIFLEYTLALSDKRLSMMPEMLEKLMLFRSWRRWEERGGQVDVRAPS